ncbi:MAG TPA: hypothetical protein PLV61_03805 [Parvularculaceae bacterium]|nr:hypothetical protein [Parvularculaceae bacterium]
MGSFVSTVLRLAVAAFLLFTATLTFDAAARMIGLGKDACGTSVNSLPRMLSAYFKGADIADSAEAICAGMKQAMRDIPGDEEPKAFINREVSKALAAGDDFVAKSWVEAAPDILGSENAAPEEFLSAKTLKAYNAAAGKDRNAFQKWWDSLADAAGGFLATFSCKREAPNFSAFAGAVASDVIAVGDVRDIAIYGCAELKAQGGENIACSTIWNFSEDCRNLEPDSFVLGLSAAGIGASAIAAVGGAPAAAGTSVIKVGKKAGKLDTPLGARLAENVTGLFDFDGLASVFKSRFTSANELGKLVDLQNDAARRALGDDLVKLFDQKKFKELKLDLDDFRRISDDMGGGAGGVFGAYRSLDVVKTSDDLRAMSRLSEGKKGSNAYVLARRAGDAATALRLVKAAYRANFLLFLTLAAATIVLVLAALGSLFAPRREVSPF